jgi:hypothetical protein
MSFTTNATTKAMTKTLYIQQRLVAGEEIEWKDFADHVTKHNGESDDHYDERVKAIWDKLVAKADVQGCVELDQADAEECVVTESDDFTNLIDELNDEVEETMPTDPGIELASKEAEMMMLKARKDAEIERLKEALTKKNDEVKQLRELETILQAKISELRRQLIAAT